MRDVAVAMAVTLAIVQPFVADAQVPEDSIAAAIQQGLKTKRSEFAQGGSSTFMAQGRGYDVTVMGPLNRVTSAAAANAKKYLPFTRDSVPPAMLDPLVVVEAHPRTPQFMNGSWKLTPDATHIVLRSKEPKDAPVIQPQRTESFSVDWSNAAGGELHGQGMRAWFALDALPPGDFDVVVITDDKEYRATVRRTSALIR